MKENKATLESQLGNEPCPVEDTEEIFWLTESDDYQSIVRAGDLLVGQYRFRESRRIYRKAMEIINDRPLLYMKLGGASLTLFDYEEAEKNYKKARECGGSERELAYPLGIMHYFKGEYDEACESFLKCLPCGDEHKIAVIYWHTLSAYRGGKTASLLGEYNKEMQVGHHTAYRDAVEIFLGDSCGFSAPIAENDLDATVINYGLSVFSAHLGLNEMAEEYSQKTLECDSVWPGIPYLAAWNDKNKGIS